MSLTGRCPHRKNPFSLASMGVDFARFLSRLVLVSKPPKRITEFE
jgi:hypothetical protein